MIKEIMLVLGLLVIIFIGKFEMLLYLIFCFWKY